MTKLIKKIRRKLKDTSLREILYLFLLRFYYKFFKYNSCSVLDTDWKFLIVLDACRYDMFKEINHLKGILKPVLSKGSTTQEWIKKNFNNKKANKVIYVSSNPYISNLKLKEYFGKNPFKKVIDVWDFGWDEKKQTVLPNIVVKECKKAIKQYPNVERFIFHFMQPHYPFLGTEKKQIGWKNSREKISKGKIMDQGYNVWEKLKKGLIKKEEVLRDYKENLQIVLKEIEKFVYPLPGKVIITADHGNALGEKRVYGHPSGIYMKELVEVPWFEVKDK